MKTILYALLCISIVTQHQTHSADFLDRYVGADNITTRTEFNMPENFSIDVQRKDTTIGHISTIKISIHENDIHHVAQLTFTIDHKQQEIVVNKLCIEKKYRRNCWGKRLSDFLKKCCCGCNCYEIKGTFSLLDEFGLVKKELFDRQKKPSLKEVFESAKQFFISQDYTLTATSTTITYPAISSFDFVWENPHMTKTKKPIHLEHQKEFMQSPKKISLYKIHANAMSEPYGYIKIDYKNKQTGYIDDLRIHDHYKSNGLGSRLFTAACINLIEQNITDITWFALADLYTLADKLKLILFYKKQGSVEDLNANSINKPFYGCYMKLNKSIAEEYYALCCSKTIPSSTQKIAQNAVNNYLYEQFTLKCGFTTLLQKMYAQKLHNAQNSSKLTDCSIKTL